MNPESAATRRDFLRLASVAGVGVVLTQVAFGQELAPPLPRQEQPGGGRAPGGPAPARTPMLYTRERPGGEMLIGPTEDLMREHAVQERVLLMYDECGRRIQERQEFPPEVLADAARLVQKFIEDYHERQEETDVFPRFQQAQQWVEVVNVLLQQHRVGRRMTEEIIRLAGSHDERGRARLPGLLYGYAHMYRAHMAREGSEVFVALLNLLSPGDFAAMAQRFEEREHYLFGENGYQKIVEQVDGMERALGIHDLNSYTPRMG